MDCPSTPIRSSSSGSGSRLMATWSSPSTIAAAADAAPPSRRRSPADWGHKEVADLLAAVDYAVREKIADPQRLGVGGWSYGGILTDYLIASDTRFKAAISGAGSGNQLSMYGTDQYILQYNAELQPPWADDTAVAQGLLSVLSRRSHQDTHPVSRRATRISTCRSRAASRCTHRCARWACRRSSSCIRGNIICSPGRATSRIGSSAISPGSTAIWEHRRLGPSDPAGGCRGCRLRIGSQIAAYDQRAAVLCRAAKPEM